MQQSLVQKLFWVILALTLISLTALGQIDLPLRNSTSPVGILSFELCAYSANCQNMVALWSPHARLMAALSLGVDYLFMTLYPASIFLGLWLLVPKVPVSLQGFTRLTAWASWVAGVADAIENYNLAQMLLGAPIEQHAWSASIAATVKFAILGWSLGWLVIVWLAFGLLGKRQA